MRTTAIATLTVGWLALAATAEELPGARDRQWPQWRGPLGTGVAPHADPPVEWSESKNIRWKVAIPGHGHASPIVWGDHVYVQTAVPTGRRVETGATSAPAAPEPPHDSGRGRGSTGPAPSELHEFVILALDRRTGRNVWQRTLCEALPHEGGHQTASHASGSPVTDGEYLIAYFGSRGLYALDMQGKVIWKRELGQMETRRGFGEGSSPALHGDTVVVTWDHEGQSFITALDKHTGEPRWRVERDEPTAWTTPVVVTVDDRPQVVASATNRIRGYDLATGALVWECGGMTGNVIPTPVVGHGVVYCASGFRGSALLAIRYAAARGDIAGSPAVLWEYDGKGTPYVPSPLLYGDLLYFLQENRAALTCVDARSGRAHYARERLEGLGDVYASIVGAADRLYIVDRDGRTLVLRHGPELKVLALNTLDESFNASPAIVDRELYLRGGKYLYCIAEH